MWAPASAAMLTEIDIFRSANALIHEHGEDASLEATHAGGCGVGEGQFGCLLMRTGGRLNVRLWLQADIQSPEIEVCITPESGRYG